MSYRHLLLCNLLGLALITTACGSQQEPQSQTKVTNGLTIGEDQFPSVVLLIMETSEGQAICTGTFVNDHQVVSAGHCVAGLAPHNPQLVYAKVTTAADGSHHYRVGARALSLVQNPQYDINAANGVNGDDLAVINFPANTAPAISRVAQTPPPIGAALTIVGYGNNRTFFENGNLTGEGSGTKRFGVNHIRAKEDGFLTFYGVPESVAGLELGALAASGSGDSGGPMFVGGQLVGVTSGGGLGETSDGLLVNVSHYVDLNSRGSRAFLAANLRP